MSLSLEEEVDKSFELVYEEFNLSSASTGEVQISAGVSAAVKKTSHKLEIKFEFSNEVIAHLNELNTKLILQVEHEDVYGCTIVDHAIWYASDARSSFGVKIPIEADEKLVICTVYLYGRLVDSSKYVELAKLF